MARKTRDVVVPPASGGSLGDLLRARGLRASEAAPAPEPSADAEAAAPPVPPALGGRLVLRRTKKGRGGKTVTLVQGVQADAAGLDAFAKRLRKALGCGASVDGDDVVVQGDQVERLAELLRSWGAARVVVGS